MDTIEQQPWPSRRRRLLHSDEIKADVVAAASQAGMSMASVALARGINGNLLRRWVREVEFQQAVVILLENKISDLGNGLASLTGIEWFTTLGESVTMVNGLIFVICVLTFRRGIMGEIITLLQRPKKT